jgi:hypothetical protein
MTTDDVYFEVAVHTLTLLPAGDESVLACMVVLHTHDLVLAEGVLPSDITTPMPGRARLHAVTQRHAAEIVSAALGQATDKDSRVLWYVRYCSETPYEFIECVPQPFLDRVLACKSVMAQSPLVQDIIPSD